MSSPIRRRGRPRGAAGESGHVTIQALDRALDVLEVLATREGMTLTEIAEALGQSVATMHRVLATLEARHFVEVSADRQDWHVGAAAFRIGSAFLRRTNLVDRSRGAMRHLMQQTGETSNLGVEWRGGVLFVSQVETQAAIRAFFPPGMVAPLHASGIGKALLAGFDAAKRDAVLRDTVLERFTPRTLTDAARLRDDLAAARRRGYALDDEERTHGMRCVAAPIFNAHGEAIAGISVSGPTARMEDGRIAAIGAAVRDAAREISHRLGADVTRIA
ncbi:HTH-type transcriptional regulator BhcR [Methylobacterium sp. JK268]